VSESVREEALTPHVVISDEEIFEAHVGGKLSAEWKAPLDTQRAPDRIVPSPLDPRVGPEVAFAVAAAAAEI
jgi:malic enzyme